MLKNKILILTLGTGKLLDDKKENQAEKEDTRARIQTMIETEQYPYIMTKYSFEDDDNIMETAFVAEPLIHQFKPDKVLIIGTIRSSWTTFFANFASTDLSIEEKVDLLIKINEMVATHGRDTKEKELKQYEQMITELYKRYLKMENDPEIDVAFIRYGLNSTELEENYQIISQHIKQTLKDEVQNEIAFDITHSFRSLPFYNFAILNYLSQLTTKNISIAHVYYGNLDVKRENNSIAPIVDLKDIIDVFNLTNGASELKNTGTAVTLLSYLPEGQLKDALKRFDLALQINSFTEIKSAVEKINVILKEGQQRQTKYTDISMMLQKVLYVDEGKSLLNLADYSQGEAQLVLSKWYRRQHRYGVAIATATEALKSMLVPFYLRNNDSVEDNKENEYNDNYRRAAIQQLELIKKASGNEMNKFLLSLEKTRKKAVIIRNTFAHNLSEDNLDMIIQDDIRQAEQGINVIDEFIEKVSKLQEYIAQDEATVFKNYMKKNIRVRKTKRIDGIRVIISLKSQNELQSNIVPNLFRSNNKKYRVFILPDELSEGMQMEMDGDFKGGFQSINRILNYLENQFTVDNNLSILLESSISKPVAMLLAQEFYKRNFEHVFYLENEDISAIGKILKCNFKF